MRLNRDNVSVDFCCDVCMWWQVEDELGISLVERYNMRMNLRMWFLNYVKFNEFFLFIMYIWGWLCQLWEVIIFSIDVKVWLYYFCYGGIYNVRVFSSMIGEIFFFELIMNDRRGQGIVFC